MGLFNDKDTFWRFLENQYRLGVLTKQQIDYLYQENPNGDRFDLKGDKWCRRVYRRESINVKDLLKPIRTNNKPDGTKEFVVPEGKEEEIISKGEQTLERANYSDLVKAFDSDRFSSEEEMWIVVEAGQGNFPFRIKLMERAELGLHPDIQDLYKENENGSEESMPIEEPLLVAVPGSIEALVGESEEGPLEDVRWLSEVNMTTPPDAPRTNSNDSSKGAEEIIVNKPDESWDKVLSSGLELEKEVDEPIDLVANRLSKLVTGKRLSLLAADHIASIFQDYFDQRINAKQTIEKIESLCKKYGIEDGVHQEILDAFIDLRFWVGKQYLGDSNIPISVDRLLVVRLGDFLRKEDIGLPKEAARDFYHLMDRVANGMTLGIVAKRFEGMVQKHKIQQFQIEELQNLFKEVWRCLTTEPIEGQKDSAQGSDGDWEKFITPGVPGEEKRIPIREEESGKMDNVIKQPGKTGKFNWKSFLLNTGIVILIVLLLVMAVWWIVSRMEMWVEIVNRVGNWHSKPLAVITAPGNFFLIVELLSAGFVIGKISETYWEDLKQWSPWSLTIGLFLLAFSSGVIGGSTMWIFLSAAFGEVIPPAINLLGLIWGVIQLLVFFGSLIAFLDVQVNNLQKLSKRGEE